MNGSSHLTPLALLRRPLEVSSSISLPSVFLTRSFPSSTSFSRPLITLTLCVGSTDLQAERPSFFPSFFFSLSLLLTHSASLRNRSDPQLPLVISNVRSRSLIRWTDRDPDRRPPPCLPARHREQCSHRAGFRGCGVEGSDDWHFPPLDADCRSNLFGVLYLSVSP